MRITKEISYGYICNVCKKKESSLPPDPLHAVHHMPEEWIEDSKRFSSHIHFCGPVCQAAYYKEKEDAEKQEQQKIIDVKLNRLEKVKQILQDTVDQFVYATIEVHHLQAVEELIHKALWNEVNCNDNSFFEWQI